MSKNISPRFDSEQIAIIDKVKGIGKNRTEKVKGMVISWLVDQGYIKKNKI